MPGHRRAADQAGSPPSLGPAGRVRAPRRPPRSRAGSAAGALPGRARRRRASTIVSASSSPGATVAPPPHGARTTNPREVTVARLQHARARQASPDPSRTSRRSSPVAVAVEVGHRVEIVGRNGADRGAVESGRRRRGPAPRTSDTRSGPRTQALVERPATVRGRTSRSVRQPPRSAMSIVASVSAAPSPRRR